MRQADKAASRDERRSSILEGAARVFYRRGFSAGTTRDIAAEVGLTQPAIYHYIGSKSDLLREIALQVGRDMMLALGIGLRAGTDPVTQLRAVIREFTVTVAKDRYAFAVFWQEHHTLPEETARQLAKDERTFLSEVAQLIEQIQALGKMPSGPPMILAEAIIGMPSWMHTWYRPDGKLSADEVAELFCALIGMGEASGTRQATDQGDLPGARTWKSGAHAAGERR